MEKWEIAKMQMDIVNEGIKKALEQEEIGEKVSEDELEDKNPVEGQRISHRGISDDWQGEHDHKGDDCNGCPVQV